MDNISSTGLDSETDEFSQGWQVSKSKKIKKKKKKVVVATRTSARIPWDGVPIVVKATQRAMARDDVAGTTNNPFTVLSNTSNSVLHSVVDDLDLEMENVDEQLDAFKAKEIARAKIAKANYANFLEKQK